MRFKVNNRYIVDAKSHDDAIRAVKMLDAMETYSIRWIDTYAKAQGYGPDFWRYDTEIKANNVKEALEKLAKKVALGGTGTANCLVMHVSNSHATYQFSGRLSDLLKKTKEQLGDSVKDAHYQLRYNNGAAADMSYLKLVKETPTQLVFKNLLYVNNDEKFIYVDKKTKVAVYNSGKKIGTITDSINDAEPEADADLDFLIEDELEAIDGYRKMIAKTSNSQLLSVLSHILDEETEHVKELRAAQAGVYKVKDAVKNNLEEYRSAVKEAVDELQKINDKYNEQDEALVRSVLRKAAAAIARAKSNYEKWMY